MLDVEEIINNISEESGKIFGEAYRKAEREHEKEKMREDIENIRTLIDQLDDDILRKIKARQKAVDIIQKIKDELDMDSKDAAREDEIKMYLVAEYPEMEDIIHHLYDYLFDRSI